MRPWMALAMLACLGGTSGAAWGAALPFRPISGPGDHFSASNLTITYENDSSLFLNVDAVSYLDLDELDRHGVPMYPEDADGRRRVWSDPDPSEVAELTPEQKDAATPPTAGVQVGVPSYISVPGTLIGGAILLVQVLSQLF